MRPRSSHSYHKSCSKPPRREKGDLLRIRKRLAKPHLLSLPDRSIAAACCNRAWKLENVQQQGTTRGRNRRSSDCQVNLRMANCQSRLSTSSNWPACKTNASTPSAGRRSSRVQTLLRLPTARCRRLRRNLTTAVSESFCWPSRGCTGVGCCHTFGESLLEISLHC